MNYNLDGMDLLPRLAVGFMGSAGGELSDEVRNRVERFGTLVGKRGHVLVTGAAPGLPQDAVLGAKRAGGVVIGVSPALNLEEHVHKYHSPTRGYDSIIFTGSGLMGREIENIRTCDIVVFAAGRSGTLGEFAIAYDEGKNIGVLTGTGGVSDSIKGMVQKFQRSGKRSETTIVYDSDPGRLVQKLIRSLDSKKPYWPKLR